MQPVPLEQIAWEMILKLVKKTSRMKQKDLLKHIMKQVPKV